VTTAEAKFVHIADYAPTGEWRVRPGRGAQNGQICRADRWVQRHGQCWLTWSGTGSKGCARLAGAEGVEGLADGCGERQGLCPHRFAAPPGAGL